MPTPPIESSDWRAITATETIPKYSLFVGHIDKPDLDDRDYRYICLDNGLKALLIHDKQADKAAACVAVAVGHLQDPDDVPGLAHFCEHMIMKGSVPYPAENDYLAFIKSNGGLSNGGTSAAWQDYWFSINPAKLLEALPRLAAFFHSPLFTASLTSREMHAVDSENKRNLQNDSRRILQLKKSLSVSGHPWTKFGTGNLSSLTEAAREKLATEDESAEQDAGDGGPIGREVRDRLLKWWKEQYCASRMSLCVMGNESLEQLTEQAVIQFSQIPNRAVDPRPTFKDPVWGPEQHSTVVFVKTVKDYYAFSLTFHIPDQAPLYRTRPAEYISHFLGHEGPGSVCAYLKKKGWVVDLSAGSTSRNRSVTRFDIEGKLTREGYLHHEEVILAIFNYLDLLRSSEWPSYHFEEIKQMAATSFRFAEKAQAHAYVKRISLDLLDSLDPKDILSGGSAALQWDEVAVRQTLEMLRPELGRVVLMARNHDILGDESAWNTEKWYGTQYQVRNLTDILMAKANAANDNAELFLPPPNPYISQDFVVKKRTVCEITRAPRQVAVNPSYTVWHKQDDQFWVPKAHVRMLIRSPVVYGTPRKAVLTRFVADLLEDALSELAYSAQLAGLSYAVLNTDIGLYLAVSGYHDKLPVLSTTLVKTLKDLEVKSDRFDVMYEQVEKSYKNFYLGQPSNLAESLMLTALTVPSWSAEEKLNEMPYIIVDDVKRHKEDLLSNTHIEALVTGNIGEDRAVSLVKLLNSTLGSRALPPAQWPRKRSVLLPTGSDLVLEKRHANPAEMNSALWYYRQMGNVSDAGLRAKTRLLVHILTEPTFTQLRTVEQLGYVVSILMWNVVGSTGLAFKIQSLKSPAFLEERVNAFIKAYRAKLESSSVDIFDAWKNALAFKLEEKAKNLREETSRFWDQIEGGYQDFERSSVEASLVRDMTLRDILDTYDRYLVPTGDSSKKISLYLAAQKLADDPSLSKTNSNVVESEMFLKARLALSPTAIPVTGNHSELYD